MAITIFPSNDSFFSSTNLNYKLDSFQSHYYGRNSIADILQNFTPVQINSYGLGGAVSISLRGTADDQTAVYWNGLKINSITLGSADISLIPINAANNIDIITNASGAALGSGTFGGAVLLNNKPIFQRKLKLSVRQDFSSFKNYRTNFSLKIGDEKIQFSSSSFYQNAKNNFLSIIKDTEQYKSENATVKVLGIYYPLVNETKVRKCVLKSAVAPTPRC